MERLLPLDRAHLTPAPKGLGDPRGEVEMFPDAWTVFEQTAPIYMHGMIFGAMTESFCAEQSARMTAMDSATKSAKDMIHDLELEYNRSRQVPSPRRSPRSSAARRRYRIKNNMLTLSGRFASSSPKGRALGIKMKFARTAKLPLWGRWHRVSDDGEGEDAEAFARNIV